jgi:hypothetical protein
MHLVARLPGDLGRWLPGILREAADAALFVFLDPLGTSLDRDQQCGCC